MNNSYTANSLPQQQQQQHQNQSEQQTAQTIAYLPAHAHLQQHLNIINEEHAANNGGAYFGTRALEKTYANYAAPSGRYYTSGSATTATGLPNLTGHNTILITNNFAQPSKLPQNDSIATVLPPTHAAHNFNNTNNVHILSTTPNNSNNNNNNNNNLFNLNKDVTIDTATLRLPHGHFYQQAHQQNQNFATHLNNLQQTHQYHPHFAALATQQQQQQQQHALNQSTMHFAASTPAPHYYTHTTTEQLSNDDNNKLMPRIIDVAATNNTKPTTNVPTNATVVLDRINICINNHYNEALTSDNNKIDTPLSCSTQQTADNTLQQEQQTSPVIPAIQHKATLLSDSVATLLSSTTENNNNNNAIHVNDEPDSTTTTAHTPPITPNNVDVEQIITLHQSPSTTTAISTKLITFEANENMEREAEAETKIAYGKIQQIDVEVLKENTPTTTIVIDCDDNEEICEQENPTTETQATDEESILNIVATKNIIEFKIGEDVLLKRQDNRFYLGTVIENTHEKYLVRFDDQSEQWCVFEEMRKLGGGEKSNKNSGDSLQNDNENHVVEDTPMCISCKQVQPNDVVEVCDRCGRGYHRGCTTEVYAGSGEWLCKRCAKPMKVCKSNENFKEQMSTVCKQLPYHVDTLNWDEKHRVNEEQIYCYCGKTGKFDNNMLQCCKCKNWFHTHCIENFKHKLLRGDW